MRSQGWLAVAAATVLTACSGGGGAGGALPPATSSTTAPTTATIVPSDVAVREIQCHLPGGTAAPAPAGATTGPDGQRVQVFPAAIALTTCQTAPALFDAFENFEGDVTATPEDPSVATVTPDSQRNAVYPTFGGLKNAWFDIIPHAAGSTRIIVRDKKGNVAYVTVTVIPCATPAPSPVPSTGACASSRHALGERQAQTGSTGGC